ncbi:hypothetical protein K504DRAFT_456370 [Pleomassaria siparia CBS 279.74]|uniref:Mid2 domain-containing protein n=1 Tax=Pleomassaria siparia CBS 279.74 TaxID=1314801 RepID=A0A6G1K6A9_9PLEO|nr:hypothetical protein K504DRAFT_456370 [Pleomassaria siparia CBS 279.74]
MKPSPFLSFLALAPSVLAQNRPVPRAAEATPFIPGQALKRVAAPRPTSPPQVVRQLLRRDAATCGWMMADGSPNVCGDSQYCTTTASNNGDFGVWNCCNTDSCYLATGCTKDVECYMSNAGTTFSRFMCGTTSSIVSMAYSREDTPQYTASQLSVSQSSAAAASALSASASRAAAGTTTTSPGQSSSSVQASNSKATSADEATTTQTKKSGLSTGALAGIVVGVILIIVLIGAIAFFIWRSKNKNKNNTAPAAHQHGPHTVAEMSGAPLMSGAPADYTGYYKPQHDTYAHQGFAQQGTPQYPVELDGPTYDGHTVVHEMGTK